MSPSVTAAEQPSGTATEIQCRAFWKMGGGNLIMTTLLGKSFRNSPLTGKNIFLFEPLFQ
jgi:hypothetical protein